MMVFAMAVATIDFRNSSNVVRHMTMTQHTY